MLEVQRWEGISREILVEAGLLHESQLYGESPLDRVFRMGGQPSSPDSHRGRPAFGRSFLTHSMKTFRSLMEAPDGHAEEPQ